MLRCVRRQDLPLKTPATISTLKYGALFRYSATNRRKFASLYEIPGPTLYNTMQYDF
jgi:hypothetical protein